jgi:DNA-binding protein HU-beta
MVSPGTLTLADIADFIAEKHGTTKALAKVIVDDVRDRMVVAVVDNRRVAIFGLGSFEARPTKAKAGRNPKTGEPLNIPAGRRVAFKPSSALKDALKN